MLIEILRPSQNTCHAQARTTTHREIRRRPPVFDEWTSARSCPQAGRSEPEFGERLLLFQERAHVSAVSRRSVCQQSVTSSTRRFHGPTSPLSLSFTGLRIWLLLYCWTTVSFSQSASQMTVLIVIKTCCGRGSDGLQHCFLKSSCSYAPRCLKHDDDCNDPWRECDRVKRVY